MAQQATSNVELEAAKFLEKVGQDFKNEPKKLATKLFTVRMFVSYIDCIFHLYQLYV